jgi:hypothetical protein
MANGAWWRTLHIVDPDATVRLIGRCLSAGGGFHLVTTKNGRATTANGVPSGPGEGTVTRNQVV